MKFAIILSGCGQHDGSEIHETIMTLLSLSEEHVEWDAFAPDMMQTEVINHLVGALDRGEKRSVLKEAARLTRGHIKPITEANLKAYDAIIFPGGMGAVKNLCNWAKDGMDFEFQSDVKRLLDEAVKLKKPMGFICIAPIMIVKIYKGAVFTIGNDASLASKIAHGGGHHQNCIATDIVVDLKHKIVSTPANMLSPSLRELHQGILKLVRELKKLAVSA